MKLTLSTKKLQALALSILACASITAYAQNSSRQWQVTAEQKSAAALAAQRGIDISEIKKDAPLSYRVKEGDTLWGISSYYLTSPWKWPALWGMNQSQINNPHLIYPGQVLTLVRNGDRVMLTTSGSNANSGGTPTVRLSPRVRLEDIEDNAIPVLPPEQVIPFMRNGIIVGKDALANAPRIVAAPDARLLLKVGEKVYVRGGNILSSPEKYYMAYTNPTPITDPEDKKKILGYQATFLGRLQLVKEGAIETNQPDMTATLVITSAQQEIRIGDRITPANSEQDLLTDFVPHAAPAGMSGRIVQLYGNSSYRHQALYGVVLLNKGQANGVERGQVVALWRPGRTITDKTAGTNWTPEKARTPDEQYGLAMVFKTFENLSYALVVQTSSTVEVGDIFTAPK